MSPDSLASTFYRVSVKALIFDDQDRLLVGLTKDRGVPGWEIPGGGWEHNETLEQCLSRELEEEFGVRLKRAGDIKFAYKNKSSRGFLKINIAVQAELESFNFKPVDMQEAKFVTKEELTHLDFAAEEIAILSEIDKIWPV